MEIEEINRQDRFHKSINDIKDKRWFSVIQNMLWSDPGVAVKKNDRGGSTIIYGISETEKFLEIYGLKELFRAHEVVHGYRENQKNICHTIFSASKYCGCDNMGGYVVCHDEGFFEKVIYETPNKLLSSDECDDCDEATPRICADTMQ